MKKQIRKSKKISFYIISIVFLIFTLSSLINNKSVYNSNLIFFFLIWLFSLGVIIQEKFNNLINLRFLRVITYTHTFILIFELSLLLIKDLNLSTFIISISASLFWLYLISITLNLNTPIKKIISFQLRSIKKSEYMTNQVKSVATFLLYIFCIIIDFILIKIIIN
jgi:hypothetical protein